MHLEDVRGILLSERDSGTLVQIPPDLYQTTATQVRSLQQEVIVMDDPFSDEARILIEKVASIRTTVEELFHLRSEKIVALAQSQADGSYIDREALRTLIPAELEMFNKIVDGIRTCRSALIEWRTGGGRLQAPVKIEPLEQTGTERAIKTSTPVSGVENPAEESEEEVGDAISSTPGTLVSDSQGIEETRAYEPETDFIHDDEGDSPFPYALVRIKTDMEPFMGVDGRTYELACGDIITIPRRNAEVLAERNIVLNINPG
ncbi:MAG TPA: hypothetical protein VN372_07540 [Methanospirillum sp.]|nr:hypothetical protein [Methanospirillum sp.]